MKPQAMIKIIIDISMTILLLLLMTYELIGQTVHEWIGIGMFVLFVVHHILNSRWSRSILRGKYTPLRILQTALVIAVLAAMLGSMVSGVILSRHALSFLPIHGGRSFGRNLHMLSAYWGFVFMGLHLGFHWNMMIGIAKKQMNQFVFTEHYFTAWLRYMQQKKQKADRFEKDIVYDYNSYCEMKWGRNHCRGTNLL